MQVSHRWRDYRTRAGRSPVKEFIDTLSEEDAVEVQAAMAEVRLRGLSSARHLRGEIYEVRSQVERVTVRILFAQEVSIQPIAAAAFILLTISLLRDTMLAEEERMTRDPDFLDELISEREQKNPAFRTMVEAALERRLMLRRLAEKRSKRGLTQTQVAAAMGTSQSSVARVESGAADVRLSTLERYAATLGERVVWRLSPVPNRGTPLGKGARVGKAEIDSLLAKRFSL